MIHLFLFYRTCLYVTTENKKKQMCLYLMVSLSVSLYFTLRRSVFCFHSDSNNNDKQNYSPLFSSHLQQTKHTYKRTHFFLNRCVYIDKKKSQFLCIYSNNRMCSHKDIFGSQFSLEQLYF